MIRPFRLKVEPPSKILGGLTMGFCLLLRILGFLPHCTSLVDKQLGIFQFEGNSAVEGRAVYLDSTCLGDFSNQRAADFKVACLILWSKVYRHDPLLVTAGE